MDRIESLDEVGIGAACEWKRIYSRGGIELEN
jgi:hypothetical protein